MASLGPEAARIFRITHVRNVPWILDHGLHCQTSNLADPNFVPPGQSVPVTQPAPRVSQVPQDDYRQRIRGMTQWR